MMTDAGVDLKVDRNLLDPHFEGYKLSLDTLPTYKINIGSKLDSIKLQDPEYSYQHIRAFGIHNHLISDTWHDNVVYFITDDWNVKMLLITLDTDLPVPESVFQIPDAANQCKFPMRHNVTCHFPAAEWAVLADGAGQLYLLETDDRALGKTWKSHYHGAVLGAEVAFEVLHSVKYNIGESHRIDCVLLHIETTINEGIPDNSSPFTTMLDWVTFTSDDQSSWTLHRTRRLTSFSTPDSVGIEPDGEGILIAAEKAFSMISDSLKPIEVKTATEKDESETMEKDEPFLYSWCQTEEDATLRFTLPEGSSKTNVLYHLTALNIEVGVKNQSTFLKGLMYARVDPEASTWTIKDNILDVLLAKEKEGLWPEVVVGERRGKNVIDPAQLEAIHDQLEKYTSDKMNPDGEKEIKKPYNTQELEECDAYPLDSATLMRIDGETHSVTHKVNLDSHQWLFTVQVDPGKAPAFCLRHDVDGIVWQPVEKPTAGNSPCKHVATFNAFGYVQASKREKKFTCCSRNYSYVVICDCVRHVHIYHQPSSTLSPIRNRKTGQVVSQVSKQQVVSLEATDEIMGMHVTHERLFFITSTTLYIVRVHVEG